MNSYYFFVSLFVVFLVPNVSSIKCWKCRSIDDPRCVDPFDNTTIAITDCKYETGSLHSPDMKTSICRKIKQKVNNEWHYIRDCAFSDVGIQGDDIFNPIGTGTKKIYIEYSMCDNKDGCNGSNQFTPKPLLLVLLAIMPFTMFI